MGRSVPLLVAALFALVALLGSASAASADAIDDRVIALANVERLRRGLAPLVAAPELQAAAASYADAMADRRFFGHEAPDGSTPVRRVEAAGYQTWTFVAENLAGGQESAEEVTAAWMNSPQHRENLLSPFAREIGVGHVYRPDAPYEYYWVEELAARPDAPAAAAPQTAPAGQAACAFGPGFAGLRAQIAGLIGACLENPHRQSDTGDELQRTTGGLLVWRTANNTAAFTDGYRTWMIGPSGLGVRLNDQRFPWEPGP